MGRVRLHRRAGDPVGRGVGGRSGLEDPAAPLLAGLPRRDPGRGRTAHHGDPGPSERSPGRAHLPRQGRRLRPARMPPVPSGTVEPEDQPVRRLHRLLALSGVQIHPPGGLARRGRRRRRERRPRTGRRSGDRAARAPEDRPLRPLCRNHAAGRGQAQALVPAQGLDPGLDRPGEGATPAQPAARRGSAPRRRQDDHRQPGPLRSVRGARRHLRQRRGHRGSVRRGPEPRRGPAG